MKYWVCNKDDGYDQAFYFETEEERETWINNSGGLEYYDTWEE